MRTDHFAADYLLDNSHMANAHAAAPLAGPLVHGCG